MSDTLTAHLGRLVTARRCLWPDGMRWLAPADNGIRAVHRSSHPLPGWTLDTADPLTAAGLLVMLEELHPGAVVWMEPGDRMDPAVSWDVWASYPGARSECLGGGMDRPAAVTAAILAVPL